MNSKALLFDIEGPFYRSKHLLCSYSHPHCHRVPSWHLPSSIGALKDWAPRNMSAWSDRSKRTVIHHKSQLGSTLSAADYLFRIKRVLNTSSKEYAHCGIIKSDHAGLSRSQKQLVIFSTPFRGSFILVLCFRHKVMWCSIPLLFTLLPHPNRYLPVCSAPKPQHATIQYKASRSFLPCQVAAQHSGSMHDNAFLVSPALRMPGSYRLPRLM